MASQSSDQLVNETIKHYFPQRGQSVLEGNGGVQAGEKLFPDVTYTDAEQKEIQKELERASKLASGGDGGAESNTLKELNQHLSTRTVLLGAKPSIADVVLYGRLAPLVKSWSREQRTGKEGHHHIVRFVNFVQSSDRFELELEPSAKVDIDPSDVEFIPKPVDPKEEKERKKKEKEAQKKAAAAETTKSAKEPAQSKASEPKAAAAAPPTAAAASRAPAAAPAEAKTDQPKSAAPAPTKSKVAAMAARFENKAKEAAEDAKTAMPIDLPRRDKRTPSAEVPKAANPPLAEEAKAANPSPAEQPKEEKKEEQPKAEKKEKKQKQPKPQKAPQGPPLSPALIDLRVGHILKAVNHPNADSLYVSTIAVGDPPGTDNTEEYEGQVVRTVCSGLNGLIPLEEMQNRKIVAVCNLKPVTMRGIKSSAMVLAASPRVKEGEDSHGGPVELVLPPEGAEAGQRIWFEGWEDEPEGQLNPKKKIWEQCQVGFTTTDELGVAFEKAEVEALKDKEDKPAVSKLRVKDGGYCSVPTLKGATVR